MSLCINPDCTKPDNSDKDMNCQSCGSLLLIQSRYRVTKLLGEGGFGRVYEVENARTAEKWVLKALIAHQQLDMEKTFKREAEVLQKLGGKGIPKLAPDGSFEFTPNGSNQPIYCIVMEKIYGKELEKYFCKDLHSKPIDLKLAIVWLKEITEILDRVHKQDFFHRDIKPSNIMINADGRLVLIDFGTIRELNHTYRMKAQGNQVTGYYSQGFTPHEQYHGQAEPRSDFFALGATFIYLLTGEYPHNLYDSSRSKYVWRDRVPDLLPSFANLIDKMLEHLPSNRPRNTSEILNQLKAIDKEIDSSNNQFYTPPSHKKTIPIKPNPTPPSLSSLQKYIIIGKLFFTPTKNWDLISLHGPKDWIYKYTDSIIRWKQYRDWTVLSLLGVIALSSFPPMRSSYYDSFGQIHLANGKLESALLDFNKAVELGAQNYGTYTHRGQTYYLLGKYEQAIADFNKSIELGECRENCYAHSGMSKHMLGRMQEAVLDYSKVIELSAKEASAYYYRGIAKQSLGQKQEAISDYQQAAILYKEQGEIKDYQTVLSLIETIKKGK